MTHPCPKQCQKADHPIQSPFYFIRTHDTWFYILTFDICGKWNPRRLCGVRCVICAHFGRKKVQFWTCTDRPLLQKPLTMRLQILTATAWSQGCGIPPNRPYTTAAPKQDTNRKGTRRRMGAYIKNRNVRKLQQGRKILSQKRYKVLCAGLNCRLSLPWHFKLGCNSQNTLH